MSDFTQYSNFRRDNSFRSIRFGSRAKILETELNEMQDIQSEARADIIRETIPSGFTTLSDLDYNYMNSNPDTIKTLSDSVAFVNGYKVVIPAGTVIQLDAPPEYDPITKTGTPTRDDLVFLEVWLQEVKNGDTVYSGGGDGQAVITPVIEDSRVGEETSRRLQLRWRIRVVDGVDFSKLFEGLGSMDGPLLNEVDLPYGLGGSNLSNLDIANNSGDDYRFSHQFFKEIPDVWKGTESLINDVGLYRAGYSTFPIENTLDGHSYAIPMFKVHRRNSGGYSANNGNGALTRTQITTISETTPGYTHSKGGFFTFTLIDASNINVGDTLGIANAYNQFKVYAKNGNSITCIDITAGNNEFTFYSTTPVFRMDRPDILFADIVDDRDILDLRHQVSLTGFNYQELLEENFDKLLRGELQTKERTKMLKTYHGISKTPIDSNVVFYASFDRTTTPEVGSAPISGSCSYQNSFTGLGFKDNGSDLYYPITLPDTFTIDGFGTFDLSPNGKSNLSNAYNASGHLSIVSNIIDINGVNYNINGLGNNGNHTRITYANNTFKIYINGILAQTINADGTFLKEINTLNLVIYTTGSRYKILEMFDLSISNIDRGSTFATLPQDFIDGYARIEPAFNSQRNVFSDALTTETKTEFVQSDSTKNKPYIHLGDATDWIKDDSTKWNAGDKIKVDTLTGEIITGIIDADTAIAKVIQPVSNNNLIYVDDVSKFSIGDTIYIYTNDFYNLGTTSITAVDTVNKTITIAGPITLNIGTLLFETTPSSSSPLVKFNLSGTAQAGGANTITLPISAEDDTYNGLAISIESGTGAGQVKNITDYVGSTKVATVDSNWTIQPDNTSIITVHNVDVGGTWSGLGTTEAIYTLPATVPSGLTNQNLTLTYAITEMSGQGGIPEVLTETLAGEYKGDKLIPNPSYHIVDDFAGKVSGSVVENPNSIYTAIASSLQTPSQFNTELSDYTNVKTLDGNCVSVTTNTNGQQPQLLIKKNLIAIVEAKYGVIPCATTKDKVDWLKANLASITANAYTYGSCPSGNKASIAVFNVHNNMGNGITARSSSFPTLLSFIITATSGDTISSCIDNNGFFCFIVYTDASDGATPSTIYTDYVDIQITLKTPSGYDVLAPENLRRDAGKSNILLVRKETKEIQLMFGSGDNLSGIISYGNYVPYQGAGISPSCNDISLNIKAKNKNFISDVGTGGYNIALSSINERQLPTNIDRGYLMNTNKGGGFFKLEELNNLINSANDRFNILTEILDDDSTLLSSIFGASSTKLLRGFMEWQGTPRNLDISTILTRFNLTTLSYIVTGLVISYLGSLFLVIVRADINSDKTVWVGSSSLNSAIDCYYLPNRPLVK